MKKQLIELRVNGRTHELAIEPSKLRAPVARAVGENRVMLTGDRQLADPFEDCRPVEPWDDFDDFLPRAEAGLFGDSETDSRRVENDVANSRDNQRQDRAEFVRTARKNMSNITDPTNGTRMARSAM